MSRGWGGCVNWMMSWYQLRNILILTICRCRGAGGGGAVITICLTSHPSPSPPAQSINSVAMWTRWHQASSTSTCGGKKQPDIIFSAYLISFFSSAVFIEDLKCVSNILTFYQSKRNSNLVTAILYENTWLQSRRRVLSQADSSWWGILHSIKKKIDPNIDKRVHIGTRTL